MSALDDAVRALLTRVDDGLGVALVDLESGFPLAATHVDTDLPEDYLDAVAAWAATLFRGRSAAAVDELLARERGSSGGSGIRELQLTTDQSFQFMVVLPTHPQVLLVLITGRRTNLGLGWSTLRTAIPELDALL